VAVAQPSLGQFRRRQASSLMFRVSRTTIANARCSA
jgi:hypothetical protein